MVEVNDGTYGRRWSSVTLREDDVFTSDLHLGDESMLRRRYERDLGRMHSAMARSWDRVVGDEQRVFVLGDVFTRGKETAFAWLKDRPGRKILVRGNWDNTDDSWLLHEGGPFDNVIDIIQVALTDGTLGWMSHYPYRRAGEESKPRLDEPDFRMPLIHGHTHSPKKLSIAAKGSLQVHVGWEAWRTPVTLERIGDYVLDWETGGN